MRIDPAILRDQLTAARYTSDAVVDRIGEDGQAGLGRNCTVPSDVALAGATDPQAALIRLFILQQAVPREQVAAAVDVEALLGAGFLKGDGGALRAVVDIRPYGSPDDGATGWVVADPTPGLDHTMSPIRPDYVLGVSPASTTLAQLTMRTPVGAALDLGTGCGVQSLHLSRHAERVVATDVNERALDLAQVTAALGGVAVDYRNGSLYEPVAGERFDLIVSNPPFVMSPPSDEADTLTYREANFEGDALVETLIRGAAEHLNPGGSLQLLTNWAVTDQPWEERLTEWIPRGCDAWVIERERLDVFSYIEMWLADAGLAGTGRWRAAYDEWLGYFERLGVRSIGMGWVLVTRAERAEPHRRFESWPHAVAQPVGEVFARHRAALDASQLPTAELLASKPRLVDVEQETLGRPGAEDPEHVVFRQRVGLLRAVKADTALAAALGALDGDLTVGQVIAAVAQVLDLDAAELAAALVPEIRQALLDQMLRLG
ncbi:class I SAM-dependent methyltransferase [Tessaracoccus lubricantis]|uniref:Class I SAM-dependent methyltransferase n=1 Tax=Tessaracoccus lubricantis TaxID=545543 RepID=A0ABP9EZ75_9ACTN